jgi:hypothetical protein
VPIKKLNICHALTGEHSPIFRELIELIIECLQGGGVQVSYTPNDIISGWLNVIVGGTMFLSPEIFIRIRELAHSYIVFQLEALDSEQGFSPNRSAYFDFLRGAKQIWDYSPQNTRHLAQLGLTNARYIPVGYSPRLERVIDLVEQDIDILFYGAINPRRRKIVEELQLCGFKTAVLFGKYGPARDTFIARTKIQLNIHQFETSHIEQLRLAYLLNNKRFVISETSEDNPYGDGVVFSDYKDIVASCAYYLKPEMGAERLRIAKLGYDRLRQIPMTNSIMNALAEVALG